MRFKISIMALLALGLVTATAVAADVTGTWVAERKRSDGQIRKATYEFKADGTNLTGTLDFDSSGNQHPISEGKIEGDNIPFVVAFTNHAGLDLKYNFKGKVAGNEMELAGKLEIEGDMGGRGSGSGSGERPPWTVIARRVK